ncbi:MAG TPA: hypothetical protein VH092_25925 [Urbifossiella sp.]|nr:hypothetical protein [Urbifossiella sp.]
MSTWGKWGLALGLLGVAVGGARSQVSEKIVAGEGAVQLMLLRQHSVQDELKLSKDQTQKVDEFAAKQWKAAHEAHHHPDADKGKARFEELGRENKTFVSGLLKADQQQRLDQISMQVAGVLWALDPKVSADIQLTADQKEKLKVLHKQAHKEVETVLHDGNKETRHARLEDLGKTHGKQLLEVLTPDQKTKWEAMAGPKFNGKLHFEEYAHPGKDK